MRLTINANVYIELIQTTGEIWRELHSNPTKLSELWWQHDNARPHTAKMTMEYLKRRDLALIKQSPYSPDLNQCNRWVFKDLKKHLRRFDLSSSEEIQEKTLQYMRELRQNDSQ